MQIIGQTEATYTSQVPEPVTLSAAFVFPETIKQLEREAKETSSNLIQLYNSILTTSLEGSASELSTKLVEVDKTEQDIKIQLMNLQKIHEELKSYNEQTKVIPQSYQFVASGYQNVAQLVRQVNETIHFQQIDEIKSSIHSKLVATNTSKEVSMNAKEDPVHNK